MKTVLEIQKEIKQDAETNCDEDNRIIDKIEVNQFIRQGDIYLTRIDKMPEGKVINELQLAPGTTKGSRHILSQDFVGRVIMPDTKESELEGPSIEAKEGFTLTHPEHANFKMPSGNYRVTYQRDFLQEEIRRVRD